MSGNLWHIKTAKMKKKLWNYSNQVLVQSLDFLHAVKTSFFLILRMTFYLLFTFKTDLFVFLKFSYPVPNFIKTCSFCQVVTQYSCTSASVIHFSHRLVPFATGSVLSVKREKIHINWLNQWISKQINK